MKPVIIESPFRGNVESTEEEHRRYLDRCIQDCIHRGETPYASHKMLTDALDDSNEHDRELGIEAGYAMGQALLTAGAKVVFYMDYGLSSGMSRAALKYTELGSTTERREIGRNGE